MLKDKLTVLTCTSLCLINKAFYSFSLPPPPPNPPKRLAFKAIYSHLMNIQSWLLNFQFYRWFGVCSLSANNPAF